MKTTWSWWGRHEIGVVLRTSWNCLCKCNHFRGVFATRVLRVYYYIRLWRSYDAWLTTFATPPRSRSDRRTLAFVLSMLKTNAVTRRSLATMATTARCLAFLPRLYHVYTTFIPRLYHVYTTLMETLARSGHIFRRRRRAVRTPPRCDGGPIFYILS